MSVRMRHTKGHIANRRSHHKVDAVRLSTCSKCQEKHVRHQVCPNCGTYKEREYIDVMAKLTKKEKKAKEEQLKAQEGDKGLDAEALSTTDKK